MENSLLWRTLSGFSRLEHKHFGQWLDSPFFCRKEEPRRLFAYLRKCLESGSAPDKASAWKSVDPKARSVDLVSLRLLNSELLKQAEHFMAHRDFFADEGKVAISIAGAYRRRGLDKHFQRSLRDARSYWEKQPFRNSAYFEAEAEIEYQEYQHLSAANRTEAFNLQALFDATDTAFIAGKLRQACFALSHQAVYKTEYRLDLIKEIVQFLELQPEWKEVPVIGLYYGCYLFLTDPEKEGHFFHFKQLLFENAALLPPDEQRDLHLLAINYGIKKINRLQSEYFRETLDLYQSALEKDLLLENGFLSPFAYNNIVAIALKVNELDWAERFVEEHAEKLEKKHRESNYQLNLARVNYLKKDYRKALLNLQEADYKDKINNLIAKALQLKIFFETEEFDLLDAHLRSMQAYIRRQRVFGYHKSNYLNLIRFTRKLLQHPPRSSQQKKAIVEEIKEANPLTEKEWLLQMIG